MIIKLPMGQIENIAERLRLRLSEYLFEHRNEEGNVHIGAVEISLCLVEYWLKKQRQIQRTELVWFDAGWYVLQLLDGTRFKDIADDYREMAKIVESMKF